MDQNGVIAVLFRIGHCRYKYVPWSRLTLGSELEFTCFHEKGVSINRQNFPVDGRCTLKTGGKIG